MKAKKKRTLDERASVRLTAGLAAIWKKIRSYHKDVPPVVLLAAPALQRNTLGHFSPLRWSGHKMGGTHHHEVVVVAEHLDRPPEDILETLLHEAAHAMNCERGLKDCTASQYHNGCFRDAAKELGLSVEKVIHYGYACTRLEPQTPKLYAEEVAKLAEVLTFHRKRPCAVNPPSGGGAGGTGNSDGDQDKKVSRHRKATCACPFTIRVSKSTIERTTIRCETCGKPFSLV